MSRKKSKRIVDDSGVQLEFLLPEDKPVVEIGPVTGEELVAIIEAAKKPLMQTESKPESESDLIPDSPTNAEPIIEAGASISERKGKKKTKNPSIIQKKMEFKLKLTPEQMIKLVEYLDIQRRVWNRGLALIEWREWYEKWEKVLEVCPNAIELGVLPVPMRWHLNNISFQQKGKRGKGGKSKKKKTEEEKEAEKQKKKAENKDKWGLCCDRVIEIACDREIREGEWIIAVADENDSKKKIEKIVTPRIPDPVNKETSGHKRDHWLKEPVLPHYRHKSDNPAFSLVRAFKQDDLPDDHYARRCVTAWIKGTLKQLGDAWVGHKNGDKGYPKYKKNRDRPDSLNYPNAKYMEYLDKEGKLKRSGIKISNGGLTLPGLGRVTPKGLKNRWGDRPATVVAIILKGNTVYLQLTGEFEKKRPAKAYRPVHWN